MADFLPKHGGYKKLLVYKIAVIIYDATDLFIKKNLEHGDRTIDQMRQAARSGKQNIVEGSEASCASKKSEIFLTNVAKASFMELLEDYQDFLRVSRMEHWDEKHPRYQKLCQYVKTDGFMNGGYIALIERLNAEELANLCITLINQAVYLLKRMISAQQAQFLKEGGISEKMSNARRSTFTSPVRQRSDPGLTPSDPRPTPVRPSSDNGLTPVRRRPSLQAIMRLAETNVKNEIFFALFLAQ